VGTDRTNDHASDPRLLFDTTSNRWFFVGFDVARRETLVAVTQGLDPVGPRLIYTFAFVGCPDQPRLGVSDRLVALSVNVFTACAFSGVRLVGGDVVLLDKTALLAGTSPAMAEFGPDARFVSITPAQAMTPASTQFFASTGYPGNSLLVYSATSVQQSTIPVTRVPIRPLFAAPSAPQAGSAVRIDTGDSRVQDAFWENGAMWVAANDGCTPTGSSGVHGCGRFIEVATNPLSVMRDDEFALDSDRHLFYPAIRTDNAGNLYAVFGYSSPTEFPSIGAVINPATATQWQALAQGTGSNESGRWGDYFGAARDPSEPSRVWITGQLGSGATGTGGWATAIAALAANPFTISNPAPPPPPPPPPPIPAGPPKDTHPPRVKALPARARRGTIAKLRYRLSEDSGESRELVTILRGTRRIGLVSTGFGAVDPGTAAYYATWRVPKTLRAGALRFCVVSMDHASNRSRPSCAALTVS
jgi:hypothetical protein